MRNVFNLPLYPPPPSTPLPPPHHKKRRETPSSLLWTKREISLRREGCDYAFRKEQKSLEKKGGELGGGAITKASHCSSSSTLELAVQRLARAGCGWGCPALGPVWKQIFQVSARHKWRSVLSGCPLWVWMSGGSPQTARDFPSFF